MQQVIKWFFDRIMAFFGVILLLPVYFVCSFLIKVLMPDGPIFFCQKRVGRNGKLFTCHKFRTMVVNHDDCNVSFAGEPRITPLGAFLRHYKIDALPELWDVLIGKMSFVGPRPDVPGYADKLTGEARNILSLRPGITGPATLKYRREDELIAQHISQLKREGDKRSTQEIAMEYNDNIIYPDKVRINLYYYHNYSLITDLKIILATVFVKPIMYAGETIG